MTKFAQPWFRASRGVWYVKHAGKQINLGPDRAAAFEEYARLITPSKAPKSQLRSSRRIPARSLPAVLDAFLTWLKKRRSAETFEWYRYRLERLAQKYPKLEASKLTIAKVEDWVDGYELSVTSRRNYFRAAKKAMKWARGRGLIRRNRIRNLEVPAGESREVVIPTEQYEQVLSLIRDPGFRDLVVTTWETGCRPQESLRVEARHVDLVNQRWVFPKSESKNKKLSRVVYMTDAASAIVRRLVELNPTGKLFRNSRGRAWTTCAVNNMFHRIQVRIGQAVMQERGLAVSEEEIDRLIPLLTPTKKVKGRPRRKKEWELRMEAKQKLTIRMARSHAPKLSLYALRHTWATNALQKGIDPLTTAILMGHSDPSMLSKVYQHLALNPAHMLSQAKKAAQ